MATSIKQLQEEANDTSISVSSLLRKAKIIATKLKQEEFLAWIDKELNGYNKDEDVPEYRILNGIPQGYNPYRGWIPYFIDNPEKQEIISKRGSSQSIGELEEVLKSKMDSYEMKYSPDVEKILREGIGNNIDLRLEISRAGIAGILEHVRNSIFSWTVKLQELGIPGDSFEFLEKEVEVAEDIKPKYQIHHIENFTGSIGERSKFEHGSITPVESFWNKFFWYVIIALLVVIVGNILSALILKNFFSIG